ncbi:MAG TPA: Ig-like domain-containing protein [Balneolales bacterium]|nr:Ig-like domain-containing protein [Balneolales bacterium]
MRILVLLLRVTAILLLLAGCGSGVEGRGGGATPADDTTPPTVESYYPDPAVDGNVASAEIQANGIKVIFDEGMAPATIDSNSFKVEEWVAGGKSVSGTVSYDVSIRTAKFIPETALAAAYEYVVTITNAVTDLAGNKLTADHSWVVTVAAPAPPGSLL